MGGLFNPSPGVEYSDDEIVAKINTATAKITRADAIEVAAILESATEKLMSDSEKTKLATVAVGAQVNPPDLLALDPLASSSLVTVEARLDAYVAEILPPGAIHVTTQVPSDPDDTTIQTQGTPIWGAAYSAFNIGYVHFTNFAGGGSMRFIVNVPKNALLHRAWLIFYAGATHGLRIVRSEIGIENTANAAQITSYADYLARPRIAIAWDDVEPWTRGVWYKSPSLVTLVQQILNKPDWVSGNAMQFLWDDRLDRSDHVWNTSRNIDLYARGVSTYAPKLYIAYTLP